MSSLTSPVMLDAGPLGRLAHPNPKPDIDNWFRALTSAGVAIVIPEITDYEVRRSLLLAGLTRSIAALDGLKATLAYAPITTAVMLRAAQLWAEARRHGHPTADPRELDADVILAAHALEAGAIVATENVGHVSRYVTAVDWRLIVP